MRGIREMDIDFYLDYVNAVNEARGPAWRYDEMKSCGANFNNFFVARGYDKYHQTFRDYRRETEQIVAALGLDSSASVLDMGCGTGAFAIHAVPYYRKVYAVDIRKSHAGLRPPKGEEGRPDQHRVPSRRVPDL